MVRSIFENFENALHKKFDFNIKFKNESLLMKFIGVLFFFNKEFMSKFITTIGNTIYFPDRNFILKNDYTACEILAHELIHVRQAKKYSRILFSLLYLFPQCLIVLAFLAPISLWFLLFLLFLLPLPAPFRAMFEVKAYTMSLFMWNLDAKNVKKIAKNDIRSKLELFANNIDKKYFKGRAYLFMWPFGTNLSNKITDIESDVISGTDEMYDFMKKSYLNAVSSYELQI